MATKRKKVTPLGGFCVINHTTPHQCNRTMKDLESEAVAYAKEIVRREAVGGKQVTLFVVEIKKVVTTMETPVSVMTFKDWMS